jgi:hypothetical protein
MKAAGAFIGLPPYLSANRQIVELRGRLWKTKAGLALCNEVRRLSSQLLGLATVTIAHFSQGLFRSTAAREVGLRMEKFGVF